MKSIVLAFLVLVTAWWPTVVVARSKVTSLRTATRQLGDDYYYNYYADAADDQAGDDNYQAETDDAAGDDAAEGDDAAGDDAAEDDAAGDYQNAGDEYQGAQDSGGENKKDYTFEDDRVFDKNDQGSGSLSMLNKAPSEWDTVDWLVASSVLLVWGAIMACLGARCCGGGGKLQSSQKLLNASLVDKSNPRPYVTIA